ncbi:transporter substrate-binding domain-containing protein [Bacterioplanes sanyensis]|nr:transporter substrate-binding domain-containing protein [Bacterioplanes sanyensis]
MIRWLLPLMLLHAFAHADDGRATDVNGADGHSTGARWSAEEQAFLAQHPVISVSNEMDWPPFDFVDDGAPSGYSIDVLEKISNILGIRFRYINGHDWATLYDMFEKREIDVIHPLYKTPEREQAGLFTTALYAGRHHFITLKDADAIESAEQLQGQTIAVIRGYATAEFMEQRYPDVDLHYTHSLEESLAAVTGGVALATIEIKDVARYALQQEGRESLRINSWFRDLDYTRDNNLYYAVRKDWPILRDLFNKALNRISVSEYEALRLKWFGSHLTTRIPLTPEEEAWLQSNPEITVSNEANYPPFNFSNGDQPQGYSVDILNLVADRIGVRLNYTPETTFEQLLQGFKDGDIDLLHSAAKTPEREKIALYSNSYITFRTRFATRTNVADIESFDDLNGKTVAAGKGWFQEEFIRTHYPGINLLLVDSAEDMLDAVASEEADATIMNEKTIAYLFSRVGYTGLKVSGWARELDNDRIQKYYFLTQPDAPVLNSLINKALGSLSTRDLEDARSKWFGSVSQGLPMVPISEAEADYLRAKGEITYCADPAWYPFEYIDEHGVQGLTRDYISLITQRTDMLVNLVRTESWVETIEALKDRRCDMALQIAETDSRLEFLDFTPPYLFFPQVVVTVNDAPFISGTKEVLDETIAAVAGYAIVEILKNKYPDMEIVEVANHEQGVRKVLEGEVFGFIDFLPSASRAISDYGAGSLKISGNLDEKISLSAGIRNDEPELTSLMSKAIESISDRQHRNIMDKWLTIKYEQSFDYSLLWKVLAVVAAVLLLFAYRSRQVAIHNKEVMAINAQLEDAIVVLKRTQSKLVESEKMTTLGRVLYGVAHELNTPLGVCLTACSMLQDDLESTAEASHRGGLSKSELRHYFADKEEVLKLIDSNLRRSAELVSVFKQLSPEEYGDELDEVNVLDFLTYVISRFSHLIQDKQIQVRYKVAEQLVIVTHPRALEVVLNQLINNVLDHAFNDASSDRQLTLSASLAGECVNIQLHDNGQGIDEEIIKKVFQPFYTTARTKGKTGLGLSIVHNLVVHRLNGSIEYAEGCPGEHDKGTCCLLTLPVSLTSGPT